MMSGLLLLKYVTSVLTVSITFVGSWFFEFTTTDKETGKRSLTPFGKRAFVASTGALILAAVSTTWTDYEADRKGAESEIRSASERNLTEAERQKAEVFRRESEKDRADTHQLLKLMNENVSKLNNADQQKALSVVQKLNSADDYKRQYPDLYNRLITARNYGEVSTVINEGLERKVAERMSQAPECQSIPVTTWSDSVFKTGHFLLNQQNASQVISFMITADGVEFEVSDYSGSNNLQNGYAFVFADGSESPKLMCSVFKSSSSCKDSTSLSPPAKSIYEIVQKKIVSKIKMDKNSYEVEPDPAKLMRATFSCISP